MPYGYEEHGWTVAMHTIAANQQRRIQDYVACGRRFGGSDESELEIVLEGALKIVAVDPVEPIARRVWDDLCAEYELRRIEPPTDKYKHLVEAFIARVHDNLRSLGEDALDDMNRRFNADYERDAQVQH